MQVWRDYKMIMSALAECIVSPVPWMVIATIAVPTILVAITLKAIF